MRAGAHPLEVASVLAIASAGDRNLDASCVSAGKDGPMVTAELGYDLPVAAKKGGGAAGLASFILIVLSVARRVLPALLKPLTWDGAAAGRPPFVVSGDRGPSEHTVRV